MSFQRAIRRYRVIAGMRDMDEIPYLKDAKSHICFLLTGDINNLENAVRRIKAFGKQVYLHLDLIHGFGNDRSALKYIKRRIDPDGILSTRTHLIRAAREEGMIAIQRLFIPDSMSVETGKHLLKQSKADAVEVMPGVVPPWIFQRLREDLDIPIIAGGLLLSEEDVKQALRNGADAVSVSNRDLWHMKTEDIGD